MKIQRKQKPISERDKAILEMRRKGNSIIIIGKHFNLKRQRIWQILKKRGDPLPKSLT